jgi:hypothetical protein
VKTKDILDEIQLTARQAGIVLPDREILRKHMNFDLRELTGKEQWDWAMIHLDPVVSTLADVREYDLPLGFPENFCSGAGESGGRYAVMISDGSSQVGLEYLSPVRFWSQNLVAESSSKPARYTIASVPGGRRQLVLSPPPDESYTIDGVYIPEDWRLTDDSDLPPVPGGSYLKFSVLARFAPGIYEPMRKEAEMVILMRAARNRDSRLVPKRNLEVESWPLSR